MKSREEDFFGDRVKLYLDKWATSLFETLNALTHEIDMMGCSKYHMFEYGSSLKPSK